MVPSPSQNSEEEALFHCFIPGVRAAFMSRAQSHYRFRVLLPASQKSFMGKPLAVQGLSRWLWGCVHFSWILVPGQAQDSFTEEFSASTVLHTEP